MDVILLKDVEKVGLRGDVVSVARGYARNFLLPRAARRGGDAGAGRGAAQARRRSGRGTRRRRPSRRGSIAETLAKTVLRFEVKAGPTGSLFGSVTPTDIADEIWRTRKIRVDRRKIDVDNIKRIGRYDVPIDVFQDVRVEVKTLVVPEGGELPSDEELEAMEAAELAERQAAAAVRTGRGRVRVRRGRGAVRRRRRPAGRGGSRTRRATDAQRLRPGRVARPGRGLSSTGRPPACGIARRSSRWERPFCPQGRRPTPLQAWVFPLQMARKDMFTTDPSTPGGRSARMIESGAMAQLAPVPSSAPVPPQNLEAEESVLGAMMLSPGAIGAVSEILDAGDFYRESHAKIYRAALALYAKGEPVDAITLTDELEERSELEDVGGRVRLHELAALVPATANAAHYARIVHETATLRGLIRAGSEISRLGWERPGETGDLVDRAEQIVFDLSQQRVTGEFTHIDQLLKESFERITALYEAGVDVTGTPSGFRDLDRLTSGFQPGNLIIVAARPSMGKSALALCMAANLAVRHGVPVGLFTLEMSKAEVTQRLMCSEAKVESQRLRTGKLAPDDWPRLTAACDKLAKAPIYVDDTGSINMMEIRSKARRLKSRAPGSRADRRRLPPADDARPATPRTACRRSRRSRARSRSSRATSRCRSSRSRSSRAPSSSAPTSARSSPTCASPARSSRTPTSSRSSTATSTTTRSPTSRGSPR